MKFRKETGNVSSKQQHNQRAENSLRPLLEITHRRERYSNVALLYIQRRLLMTLSCTLVISTSSYSLDVFLITYSVLLKPLYDNHQ